MKYQPILIPDVNFLLSSAAEYYNIVALFCEKQKSLILQIVFKMEFIVVPYFAYDRAYTHA